MSHDEKTTRISLRKEGTLFYVLPKKITSRAIGFDLDWTLTYGQNHLYPRDESDIHILPNRVKKLRKLYRKGFTLIIFTNQLSTNSMEKIKRVEFFLNEIGIDMGAFVASAKDDYRKPEQGMIKKFRQLFPDTELEYYVGDALGRPQDFSDSDKQFAECANVLYASPEEVFRAQIPSIPSIPKQLIIFIGAPGTGKSTFYQEFLCQDCVQDYVHANQDILKTDAKVKNCVRQAMEQGRNVCLDRTNGKKSQRQDYVDLADQYGYTVRYFYFVRCGYGWNQTREKPVPDIAYHIFYKNLELPEQYELCCF